MKAPIWLDAAIETPHNAIETFPEVIEWPQLLSSGMEAAAADVELRKRRVGKQLVEAGRAPVDEPSLP